MLPQARQHQRFLAENPELSAKERKAAAETERVLREAGIPYERIGYTVVAKVGDGGPAVFIRGDVDALPVKGQAESPRHSLEPAGNWRYHRRSDPASNPMGAAHLCGHDGHAGGLMAVTLAARKLQLEGRLPGSLVAGFQSSEEDAEKSGGRELLWSGMLQELGVEAAVAAHLVGDRPYRSATADPGLVNAMCAPFKLTVEGISGHGGYKRPGERVRELDLLAQHDPDAAWQARLADGIGVRPTLAASAFEVALWREIQARFGDQVVMNIGWSRAGDAPVYNVIPGAAEKLGGLRVLSDDPKVHQAALDLVRETASRQAIEWGCKVKELSFPPGLPPVVNDALLAAITQELLPAAGLTLGAERRTPGGDDFALYRELGIPTLYSFVGLDGAPGWKKANIHDPDWRTPEVATELVARADVAMYFAALRRLGMTAA